MHRGAAKFAAPVETHQFDQYSDPDAVAPIIAGWRNTSMVVVESADHFLAGRTHAVAERTVAWLTERFPTAS